jgi:hypothetical protein
VASQIRVQKDSTFAWEILEYGEVYSTRHATVQVLFGRVVTALSRRRSVRYNTRRIAIFVFVAA